MHYVLMDIDGVMSPLGPISDPHITFPLEAVIRVREEVLTWFCGVQPMEQGDTREEVSVRENEGKHSVDEDREYVIELACDEVSLHGVVRMVEDVLTPAVQEESGAPEHLDTFTVGKVTVLLCVHGLTDDSQVDQQA